MKRFLLKSFGQCRFLVALCLMLVSVMAIKAQATSDEINEAIVNSPVSLKWQNDKEHPWRVYDDSTIRCSLKSGESTILSTSFSVDKPSLFTSNFDCEYNYYGNSYSVNIYVDDVLAFYKQNHSGDIKIVLEPGDHTIAYTFTYQSDNVGNLHLNEVRISQQWDVVRVDHPGDFLIKFQNLSETITNRDIELLKISGTMSSDDWQDFRNWIYNERKSHDIVGIDISDTDITEIPDYCFSQYAINSYGNEEDFYLFDYLSTVFFPETLKKINNYAFKGNQNIYKICLPASVESIGNDIFRNSSLRELSIAENSKLTTIGSYAFCNSKLQQLKMPDSVKSLGYDAFYNCGFLENITLSNSLSYIPEECFKSSAIKTLEIPDGVKTLYKEAFSNCPSLRKITLNSYTNNLQDTFSECTALDTIIIKSLTPPSIVATSDPFNNIKKEAVNLFVPKFAFEDFKNDTYWAQFTHLKELEGSLECDFFAIHGNISLTEEHQFTGSPSIEIENSAVLEVAENLTVNLNDVVYNYREELPGCFLNNGGNVTAKSLTSKFEVPSGGKWYFFSPVSDVKMSDVSFSTNSSWVIRYYDGARRATENSDSGNWKNVPADGLLKRGQGYAIQAASPGTLFMYMSTTDSGNLPFFGMNEADLTISDNVCEDVKNTGWNLIANPYPAYYDISHMDLDAPITIWNGSTYRAYSLLDDKYALRPLQPFFVQKYATDLTIGMPINGRQCDYSIRRGNSQRIREAESSRKCYDLEISQLNNEVADDYTRIVINEDALLDFEGHRDAYKMMSMNTAVAQIYSISADKNIMAINERPYSDGNVYLGVYIPKIGKEYCISLVNSDYRVWLYDSETGDEQDLSESAYTFISQKVGVDESRFSIRFDFNDTNVVDSVESAEVKIAAGKGVITISCSSKSEMALFATDGTVIANKKIENGTHEIPVGAGVYVLIVNGKDYKVVVK